MDCKSEYDFTLILSGVDAIDEQLENALFESGCDDATISSRHGCVYVTFARRAESMLDAVVSAIRDIQRADTSAVVFRVDDCSLVTQAEIARRCGRSRQVIQMYIAGERGPGRFPPPACRITDKHPLWHWCEVSEWLVEHQMLRHEEFMEALDIDMINAYLDWERQKASSPERIRNMRQQLSMNDNNDTGEVPEFC